MTTIIKKPFAFFLLALVFLVAPVYASNPIVTHMYTADPTAKVFNDRVYVYASHDFDGQAWWHMKDYHVYSSDDMVNWQDHGLAFAAEDVTWAKEFYAPDCVYRNGKYYLYFPDGVRTIGVAVSDTPYGPFKDALGKPLLDKNTPGAENVRWIFDPSVFIDDDGQAYIYFGGHSPGHARVIKLKDNMIETEGEATVIDAPEFFEASFVHKHKGHYYFSYSTNKRPHRIDYMMSDNPVSGWQYKGVLFENPPENNGKNNHHSVVAYKDRWYFFYHNRRLAAIEGMSDFHRSINADYLYYNYDGTIQTVIPTNQGVDQLKTINAFAVNEAEMFDQQGGVEVGYQDKNAGVYLTSLHDGDWVKYSGVEFAKGAKAVTFDYASAKGATIEIRTDSKTGPLLGSCKLKATKRFNKWRKQSCQIENIEGVQDVFLVIKGQVGELLNLNTYEYAKK